MRFKRPSYPPSENEAINIHFNEVFFHEGKFVSKRLLASELCFRVPHGKTVPQTAPHCCSPQAAVIFTSWTVTQENRSSETVSKRLCVSLQWGGC